MRIPAKKIELRFIKREHLTTDIYAYYFDRHQVEFTFLAGQYVQLTLPHKNADERGSSRYFTITSSPTEKDYVIITTRVGKSSFKKALFQLEPGMKVQFFGPIGTFLLTED